MIIFYFMEPTERRAINIYTAWGTRGLIICWHPPWTNDQRIRRLTIALAILWALESLEKGVNVPWKLARYFPVFATNPEGLEKLSSILAGSSHGRQLFSSYFPVLPLSPSSYNPVRTRRDWWKFLLYFMFLWIPVFGILVDSVARSRVKLE